jgi:hypothetical protein
MAAYICYAAIMKRTTVFLSDEMHAQLRQDAFRSRTSMAELIRARLRRSTGGPRRRGAARDPLLKVAGVCRGPILSTDIDGSLYGR